MIASTHPHQPLGQSNASRAIGTQKTFFPEKGSMSKTDKQQAHFIDL